MGEETVIQPCCDAWAKAHQGGTDNEGYGRLIRDWGYVDAYDVSMLTMGSYLPEVRFCPWCGHPKTSIQAGGK